MFFHRVFILSINSIDFFDLIELHAYSFALLALGFYILRVVALQLIRKHHFFCQPLPIVVYVDWACSLGLLGTQCKRDWWQNRVYICCLCVRDGFLGRFLLKEIRFDVLAFVGAGSLKPMRLELLWVLEKISLDNILSPGEVGVVKIPVGLAHGDSLAGAQVTEDSRDTQLCLAIEQVLDGLSAHD